LILGFTRRRFSFDRTLHQAAWRWAKNCAELQCAVLLIHLGLMVENVFENNQKKLPTSTTRKKHETD